LSVPPAQSVGDWYDFIPFEDGSWGLVLADVAGKGAAAALLMSATRGISALFGRNLLPSSRCVEPAQSRPGK